MANSGYAGENRKKEKRRQKVGERTKAKKKKKRKEKPIKKKINDLNMYQGTSRRDAQAH